jgi:hypothetical protein
MRTAAVTRPVNHGRATRVERTSSFPVLPDSFSAEVIERYGVVSATSNAWVWTIQSAIALACASDITTNRRNEGDEVVEQRRAVLGGIGHQRRRL